MQRICTSLAYNKHIVPTEEKTPYLHIFIYFLRCQGGLYAHSLVIGISRYISLYIHIYVLFDVLCTTYIIHGVYIYMVYII